MDRNSVSKDYGNYNYLDGRILLSYPIKNNYYVSAGIESNILLFNINSKYIKNFKEPNRFVPSPIVSINKEFKNNRIGYFII